MNRTLDTLILIAGFLASLAFVVWAVFEATS